MAQKTFTKRGKYYVCENRHLTCTIDPQEVTCDILEKRTGTLWEGRFKSSIVSKDGYLLSCSRYIESNPVRAKMVDKPSDYPWSSFRAKAEGALDSLLDLDPLYLGFGKTEKERQLNYKKWFLESFAEYEQESKLIAYATQKGAIIGNKEFISKISELLGKDIMLKQRGRPKKSL